MSTRDEDLDMIIRNHDVDSVSTGPCAEKGCGDRGMWSFKGVVRCTPHTAGALRKAGRR